MKLDLAAGVDVEIKLEFRGSSATCTTPTRGRNARDAFR